MTRVRRAVSSDESYVKPIEGSAAIRSESIGMGGVSVFKRRSPSASTGATSRPCASLTPVVLRPLPFNRPVIVSTVPTVRVFATPSTSMDVSPTVFVFSTIFNSVVEANTAASR